jgi:predicted O-methyltransferase YrrM
MIEKHAVGSKVAVEIGSYQGVSAARIASVMPNDGILYCIDPWDRQNGKVNPCYEIFRRHLKRRQSWNKIRVVQMTSNEACDSVPDEVDFIFVDGDHSWSGIEADWSLVGEKLQVGGVVCLHDSFIPPGEPWRKFDSTRFFAAIISKDPAFELVDRVHSLAVLKRRNSQARSVHG